MAQDQKRAKATAASRLSALYGGVQFGDEADVIQDHVVGTSLEKKIKALLGIELVGPFKVLTEVEEPEKKDLHCWYRCVNENSALWLKGGSKREETVGHERH